MKREPVCAAWWTDDVMAKDLCSSLSDVSSFKRRYWYICGKPTNQQCQMWGREGGRPVIGRPLVRSPGLHVEGSFSKMLNLKLLLMSRMAPWVYKYLKIGHLLTCTTSVQMWNKPLLNLASAVVAAYSLNSSRFYWIQSEWWNTAKYIYLFRMKIWNTVR